MASAFGSCPICVEDYDLAVRVPKSLECRHVLCRICLEKVVNTLNACPMCREPVRDHENLPNDFTMMDYLQRNQSDADVKEQAILRTTLQELSDNAKKELEETESILQQVNETDQSFESRARQIFERCIEMHRHKTPITSYDRDEVESKLERLQHSVAVCMSLLDGVYISMDDVESCEAEVKEAVKKLHRREPTEEVSWNNYRQQLIDAFTEMSQDPPSSDSNISEAESSETVHMDSPGANSPAHTSETVNPPPIQQQLSGDYSTLREISRYKIRWGETMCGALYHNDRLFTVEGRESSSDSLCMYQVTGQGLTLLDTEDLGVDTCTNPCMDCHTQQVYIPRTHSRGVSVVSWKDKRLTPHRLLTCVGVCWSVGVLSPYMLLACDGRSSTVRVVSVTDNTITATLKKPEEVRFETPNQLAVTGNTILVMYGRYLSGDHNLVVYENGVDSPGTIIDWPVGLQAVSDISPGGETSFLICDSSNAVFILDVSDNLCEKINIDTDSEVYGCTVVDGKLWAGSWNGDIIVLAPH